MRRTVERRIVDEALVDDARVGWSANHVGPATVNPSVDPSAALTEPGDVAYVPRSRIELNVALAQLVRDMPDDAAPRVYRSIRQALHSAEQKDDEDDAMKNTQSAETGEQARVEEAVRKAVRAQLATLDRKQLAGIAWALHEAPHAPDPADAQADADPDEPEDAEGRPKRRGAYKSTALGGMHDVGGATLEKIAAELGFSVPGAKQAVDKALKKARFLAVHMDEEDREILVLTAMNDYIDMLTRSGEVTAADVQLMKDHPDIVRDLDGFREFLHNYIRRARKEEGDEEEEHEQQAAAASTAAAPTAPKAPPAAKSPKMTYKIYKGGARWGGRPVVTRFKGKVYGPSGETAFAPNEQGEVSPSASGALNVKKTGSDHTQTWDPVDEA